MAANFDATKLSLVGDHVITTPETNQTVSITDVISEGPIYGLVEGKASVYLNDDRIVSPEEGGTHTTATNTASIALTNGSTSITINNATITAFSDSDTKALKILNSHGNITVSGALSNAQGYPTLKVTRSAGVSFADNMLASFAYGATNVSARLIPADSTAKTALGLLDLGENKEIPGYLVARDDGDNAYFSPSYEYAQTFTNDIGTTAYNYTLVLDTIVYLTDVSGTTKLTAGWSLTSGTYKFIDLGAVQAAKTALQQATDGKYKGAQLQFRVGTLYQDVFSGEGGVGATSKVATPNESIELTQGYTINTYDRKHGGGASGVTETGTQAKRVYIGTAGPNQSGSALGFDLSASQVKEVDEIKIGIQYPGGFNRINSAGNDRDTMQVYKFELQIKRNGSFGDLIVLDENKIHKGSWKDGVTFEHVYDLSLYKPFDDFKILISRKTAHDGAAYVVKSGENGERFFGDTNQTVAKIATLTSVIKEPLRMPYTAMGKVSFNTEAFQNVPPRGYHCRGLLVKVPSNYVTREENGSLAATYNRNVTTGALESKYQDWDGNFREGLVYTNNPAWILYDILTNNRYGLGDFLQTTDIDKYSLYRIGRYCDELVPDGKGGTEPRYTLNTYITKEVDAYKVLKDIVTNFLGILYYIDGEVYPVHDSPASPIYSFTKANVIDGLFSYETTGSKTRTNQIVVTWNNPANSFKQEVLIVEDRDDIVNSGKIMPTNAYAFGCTSEGQATRYGKWKLWTAANQREVVSFSTGTSGGFLRPGDVVNVQDASRYNSRYGGRISNTGTLSQTVVPLDSAVTLNSGSTYKLAVIIVQPGAYLAEDTDSSGLAITGAPNTPFFKGDLITQAFIDHNGDGTYTLQNIDTKEKAANAKRTATADDALVLNWRDDFRTEIHPVTTSAGTVTSLTVSGGFIDTPGRGDIWALIEEKDAAVVDGSAKEYKILSISEDRDNQTYQISGVEYYDTKYGEIEETFSTYVPETIYPAVRSEDIVPACLEVWNSATKYNIETVGNEVTVQWKPPIQTKTVVDEEGTESTITTSTTYEEIKQFQVSHNLPPSPLYPKSPFVVSKDTYSFTFKGLIDGEYTVSVRVLNTIDNLSTAKFTTFSIENAPTEILNTFPENLPFGGITNKQVSLNSSTGLFKFSSFNFELHAPQARSAARINTNSTAERWQQDCSGIAATTTVYDAGEFAHDHYYIVYDAVITSGHHLKLIKYNTYQNSVGHTVSYWYDAGDGNDNESVHGNGRSVSLQGTVSKEANSDKITGSGTAFLTNFSVGSFFQGGTVSAKVSRVVSDTEMYIDLIDESSFTNDSTYYTANYTPDPATDFIIAKVYKTGSIFYLESYLTYDATKEEVTTPPSKDILAHHFECNSKNGTLILDSVLGTYDSNRGIVTGTESISTNSNLGKSLQFSANNDGVLLLPTSTSETLVASDFSMFLWFNTTTGGGSSGSGSLFSRSGHASSTGSFSVQVRQDDNINQGLRLSVSARQSDASVEFVTVGTSGAGVITSNTWHHAGIVKRGTNIEVYFDGVLQGQIADFQEHSSVTSSSHPICVAAYGGASGPTISAASCFTGNISDIRVYNTSLSENQVTALYLDPAAQSGGTGLDLGTIGPSSKLLLGQSTDKYIALDGTNLSNANNGTDIFRMYAPYDDPDSARIKIDSFGNLTLSPTGGISGTGLHNLDLSTGTLTLADNQLSADKIGGGTLDTSNVTIAADKTLTLATNADTVVGGTTRTDGRISGDGIKGGRITFDNGVANQGMRGINSDALIDYMDINLESGDKLDAKSGSEIEISSGAEFEIVSGATVKIGGGTDTNGKIPVGALVDATHAIDISGSAAEAAKLSTPRTIGGVRTFDGSANMVLNLGDLSNVVETGVANGKVLKYSSTNSRWEPATDLSGSGSGGIELTDLSATGGSNSTGGALSYNSSNGTFTYTPVTDITGNAGTATALETARVFTVGSTSHSFNGTANINLTEAIQDAVGAMFTGNTETAITATYQDADGTIDLVVDTSSAIALTDLSIASEPSAAGDGSLAYNNSTGVFTYTPPLNITGNAATATALANPRDIALTGIVTGTASDFDGTGDASITTAIADDAISGDKVHGGTISDATITNSPSIATQSHGTSANWKAAYDAVPTFATSTNARTDFVLKPYTSGDYGTGTSPTVGSAFSSTQVKVYGWFYQISKLVTFTIRIKFESSFSRGTDASQYLLVEFPSAMPASQANLLDDTLGFVWEHLAHGAYRANGYFRTGGYSYTYENLHGAIQQNSRQMFLAGDLFRINESTGVRSHGASGNISNTYADIASGSEDGSVQHRLGARPDRVAQQFIANSQQMMFSGTYLAA